MKLRSGKITNANKGNILEAEYSFLQSLIRRIKHWRTFETPPRTHESVKLPAYLMQEKNKRLLQALLQLRASKETVLPNTLDHWTTVSNLKSILKYKAFLGHTALMNYKIAFNANVFDDIDRDNLDDNVICFCPYYVDPCAIIDGDYQSKPDLIALRIDPHQLHKEGKYNYFFKITDLCSHNFNKVIKVSKDLKIIIARNNTQNLTNAFEVTFKYLGFSYSVGFANEECLFYGNYFQIRHFCLQLLFTTLEKCRASLFKEAVYQYLNTLDNAKIQALLLEFSKSMIQVSELNIQGHLPLTPFLIQNIHFTHSFMTLKVPQDSENDYQNALEAVANKKNLSCYTLNDEIVYTADTADTDSDKYKIFIYDTPLNVTYVKNQLFFHYQFKKSSLNNLVTPANPEQAYLVVTTSTNKLSFTGNES